MGSSWHHPTPPTYAPPGGEQRPGPVARIARAVRQLGKFCAAVIRAVRSVRIMLRRHGIGLTPAEQRAFNRRRRVERRARRRVLLRDLRVEARARSRARAAAGGAW